MALVGWGLDYLIPVDYLQVWPFVQPLLKEVALGVSFAC